MFCNISLRSFVLLSLLGFCSSPGLPALGQSPTVAPVLTRAPAQLNLDDCLRLAHEQNRSVLGSQTRVKAASARLDQVKAGQFPTAIGTVQDTNYNSAGSPFSAKEQVLQRLTVSDSIQPFGRYRSQKNAAKAGVRAARADEAKTLIDTDFLVIKTFYDLLLAQQLIKVASDSVDQLTSHRNNTEALVKAGSTARFDLLRAEVQLAAARPPLIRAQATIANSMADLMHLLGLDPQAAPEMIGSFPEALPIPATEDEALDIAFKQRPDLESFRQQERGSFYSLKAARQGFQPSLQFAQSWDHSKGLRFPTDAFQYSSFTQISLSYPFLDSGLTRAKSQEAAATHDQARITLENAISNTLVEIRKAFSSLKEAKEVLRSQEKNVEQATEALSIAESAYEAGSRTSLDVLDAQVALTQARTLRYQALHDHSIALVQLRRSLGQPPLPGNSPPASN